MIDVFLSGLLIGPSGALMAYSGLRGLKAYVTDAEWGRGWRGYDGFMFSLLATGFAVTVTAVTWSPGVLTDTTLVLMVMNAIVYVPLALYGALRSIRFVIRLSAKGALHTHEDADRVDLKETF